MEPNSEGILRNLFHTQGEWNLTGYANPRVDELILKIATEMVTYGRDAYLEEAWKIVTDDVVYLPIRHGVSVFAMRKDLEIPPQPVGHSALSLGAADRSKRQVKVSLGSGVTLQATCRHGLLLRVKPPKPRENGHTPF